MPIVGELVHDRAWLDAQSGMTSYATIAAKLQGALADDEARAIALEIDSPGGEAVPALWRLAAEVRAARGRKPIWAIADPIAFSAAYAIAAGAERVILARTGGVGSIGCVIAHASWARSLEARGIDVELFRSGDRKARGGPLEALDDRTRARFRDVLELEYAQFAEFVAEARGLERKAIDALEGDVAHGAAAVDLGLADAVAHLDQALAELAEHVRRPATMEHVMSENRAAATPPREPEDAISRARHDEAIAAACAGGEKAGRAAERARIQAIVTGEAAQGRAKLAHELAFATDLSAEQANGILAAAALEAPARQTDALAEAMRAEPNPDIGPSAAAASEPSAAEVGRRIALGEAQGGESA